MTDRDAPAIERHQIFVGGPDSLTLELPVNAEAHWTMGKVLRNVDRNFVLPFVRTEAQPALGDSDPLAGSDLRVGLTFAETGQWVAVDDVAGEYGEGDTCAEAVQDLIVSLFEIRDVLRERHDRLSRHLVLKLQKLEDSLIDEMR